jgi:hypothetical protein
VDRNEFIELPPNDARDLRGRREIAKSMLAHLPELVTPSGSLLLTGWSPSGDWLRPRDLAGCLNHFAQQQVLLFGLSEAEIATLHDVIAQAG